MKEKIESILGKKVVLVHPKDLKNGDYTIIADVETAEEDLKKLEASKLEEIDKVELVNKRFINIYLSQKFFQESLEKVIEKGENFGKGDKFKGERAMVEHTDPNPFKEFHIGHLMPNVIGSTIARIFEWSGAEVKQVNYQGDVGLHIAKALWANGDYAKGNKAYEEDLEAKKEIQEINKKVYEKSDPELNKRYEEGKKKSLAKFEEMYKRLGTKFDYYFFESETGEVGKKIVLENIGKVFEESDGAVVFKGSHTRVFMNSQGLPTYEAKDLGNAKLKYEKYPYTKSLIVTGNEIKDYFKVVLEAMAQVLPELANKTLHLPHGMLRLSTGKMSSRTGTIISAEDLIDEVKTRVKGDEQVAIGAIKYMILRQAIGHDIIFDFEKSVSTEGDSGVYLQYAHARACSVLEKAGSQGRTLNTDLPAGEAGSQGPTLVRLLYRFPEIIERAALEYAPNYITTYLTELASSFNNFYAREQIIGNDYRLAITRAFRIVMRNGLEILGIPAPDKM